MIKPGPNNEWKVRRAGFQNRAGKSVACVTPAGRRDAPRRVAPGWVTTDRVTEQH